MVPQRHFYRPTEQCAAEEGSRMPDDIVYRCFIYVFDEQEGSGAFEGHLTFMNTLMLTLRP